MAKTTLAKRPGQTRAPTAPPKGRGRPTIRIPETADKICELIAAGKSLRQICRSPGMPDVTAVLDWLDADENFARRYGRARERQAEHFAEEIIAIADDGSNDTYVDEEGNVKIDHDVIARSKLRVEARKWVAAKLLPHKYGDRVEVDQKTTVEAGPSLLELAERVRGASPLLERRRRERVIEVEPERLE